MNKALENLLSSVKDCIFCPIMSENEQNNIPYIPIMAKPYAKVIFLGRDPNPNSVNLVGEKNSRSSFMREIFAIIQKARLDEESVYITDIFKCHWRVSSGKITFIRGTENRAPKIPQNYLNICIKEWLVKEFELIKPTLIVAFGEETYDALKCFITKPYPPLVKFSATKDKSEMDVELWQHENGCQKIKIGSCNYSFFVLRHPGNFGLKEDDVRYKIHDFNKNMLINLLGKENKEDVWRNRK